MKATTQSSENLGLMLFGKTRRGVLALFDGPPDRSLSRREIARAVGAGQGAGPRDRAEWMAALAAGGSRATRQAQEMIALTRQLHANVTAWLKKNHPKLLKSTP